MTIRELYREFAAAKLRHDDEMESQTFGAFQTVRVWVVTKNKKRMPAFETLLPKRKEGQQSIEQMRRSMELIRQQYGLNMSTSQGGTQN